MGWKEDNVRIVFVGASKVAVATAGKLLEHGHEVIIIELNKQRIEELSQDLDCGFLHGDGSKPAILREADPGSADVLLSLTSSDQINIIAGLVGHSLGFKKVVAKIEDQELIHICNELGLENTIIPTRTISRLLSDMVEGRDILELSTMIRGDARFSSFIVRGEDEGTVSDLKLPDSSRIIYYYRNDKFILADPESKLKKGDEIIVLTHSDNLKAVRDRFTAQGAENEK